MPNKTPDSFYKRKIKPLLPAGLRNRLADLKKSIRLQKRTAYRISHEGTGKLGPEYSRSRDLMEIDLTYLCNLSCHHCNRSCPQAPSDDRISIEQIKKMLAESVAKKITWKRMRLLGGEPTLNPDLVAIVKEIFNYKKEYSPDMQIILVTNGVLDKSRELALELNRDYEVIIEDSSKQPFRQLEFIAFNQAPLDDPKYKDVDYTNGCHILKDCGLGFTPYGFYPCAIAGGIDRILGKDIARKSVPETDDEMLDQLETLCAWCGHFRMNYGSAKDQGASPSWISTYEEYRKNKPELNKY
jgi:hypothetical protein